MTKSYSIKPEAVRKKIYRDREKMLMEKDPSKAFKTCKMKFYTKTLKKCLRKKVNFSDVIHHLDQLEVDDDYETIKAVAKYIQTSASRTLFDKTIALSTDDFIKFRIGHFRAEVKDGYQLFIHQIVQNSIEKPFLVNSNAFKKDFYRQQYNSVHRIGGFIKNPLWYYLKVTELKKIISLHSSLNLFLQTILTSPSENKELYIMASILFDRTEEVVTPDCFPFVKKHQDFNLYSGNAWILFIPLDSDLTMLDGIVLSKGKHKMKVRYDMGTMIILGADIKHMAQQRDQGCLYSKQYFGKTQRRILQIFVTPKIPLFGLELKELSFNNILYFKDILYVIDKKFKIRTISSNEEKYVNILQRQISF